MGLIDANKLIEDIRKRNYISKALSEIFETIIDEQPTAYDVDKVVEQLEELKERYNSVDFGIKGIICKAIEIVKAGGECGNCIEAGGCLKRSDCTNMSKGKIKAGGRDER